MPFRHIDPSLGVVEPHFRTKYPQSSNWVNVFPKFRDEHDKTKNNLDTIQVHDIHV